MILALPPAHLPGAGSTAARGTGGLAAEAQMLDRMAAAVGHTLDGLLSGKGQALLCMCSMPADMSCFPAPIFSVLVLRPAE